MVLTEHYVEHVTCKGLLRAGDDDSTNVAIGIVATKSFVDFGEQVVAQGVQGLRTVQSDKTDLTAGLGEDVLVAASSTSSSGLWLV